MPPALKRPFEMDENKIKAFLVPKIAERWNIKQHVGVQTHLEHLVHYLIMRPRGELGYSAMFASKESENIPHLSLNQKTMTICSVAYFSPFFLLHWAW